MDGEFTDVMSTRTDAELLEVINSSPGDYQPAALEAAKIEFKKRHLSNEQIALAKDEIKQRQDLEDVQNNEPLSTSGKILAFIFPGSFLSILWGNTYKTGVRKDNEYSRWNLYGWCFYIGIIVISLLVISLLKK